MALNAYNFYSFSQIMAALNVSLRGAGSLQRSTTIHLEKYNLCCPLLASYLRLYKTKLLHVGAKVLYLGRHKIKLEKQSFPRLKIV